MQDQLSEPVTIDDLARTVNFSKFHFARIFRRVTGISPRHFLSAMRMEEAKRLLVTTSMTVAEISHRVGYTSVGAFTSRFGANVGLSPTLYRRFKGRAPHIGEDDSYAGGESATVDVALCPPCGARLGVTFVGLFANQILEGRPVRCGIVRQAGSCRLENVPLGRWYVLAAAIDGQHGPVTDPAELAGRQEYVAAHGPFDIRSADSTLTATVRLRPRRLTDPPVILALLDTPQGATP